MKRFNLNTPHDADSNPFDPTGSVLTSTEVGPAIRELAATVGVSASPGFTWGDSGNTKNSYLQNDTVPSNLAGRIVPVTGFIRAISVTSANATDAEVQVQRRDPGPTFVPLTTVQMPTDRKAIFILGEPYPAVTVGDELAIFITNFAAISNPVVGLIILGSV
jgi:hypothetical protein